MYPKVERPKENKSRAVANSVAQEETGGQGFGLIENCVENILQRKTQLKPVSFISQLPKQKEVNNLESIMDNLSGTTIQQKGSGNPIIAQNEDNKFTFSDHPHKLKMPVPKPGLINAGHHSMARNTYPVVQYKPSLDGDLKGPYLEKTTMLANSGSKSVSDFVIIAQKLVSEFATDFFQKISAPLPKITILESQTAGEGEFDYAEWSLAIGASTSNQTVDKNTAALIFGAIYHELRHAEQAVRAVLWAVSKDKPDITIERELGIQNTILRQIKIGLTKENETDKEAETWYGSRRDGDDVMKDLAKNSLLLEEGKSILTDKLPILSNKLSGTSQILKESVTNSIDLEKTMDSYYDDIVEIRKFSASNQYLAPFIKIENNVSAYRNLSHEKDAHLLGWKIEDSIRGAARVDSYVEISKSNLNTTLSKADKALEVLESASLEASVGEMKETKEQLLIQITKTEEAVNELNTNWNIQGITNLIKTIKHGVCGENRKI
jgi:hypothetical protein